MFYLWKVFKDYKIYFTFKRKSGYLFEIFKIWVKFWYRYWCFSVDILLYHICYKSFNSFCRSDTGEEVMFQTIQYIHTSLHRYKFDDYDSQDNVDLCTLQEINEFISELFCECKSYFVTRFVWKIQGKVRNY